jgi:voltage-gated potassium channel
VRAQRRLRAVDALVLLLALASVALVLLHALTDPDAVAQRRIRFAEYALIALFAFEFLFALARHDHRVAYALRNWYEVLALVPVASGPALALSWYPALAVAVCLARFGRVVDRLFGDEAFHRMVERARSAAVESVADAVTLRVLDQTLAVLQKGEYTRNLADALERHGDGMVAIVAEKVKQDPEVGAVRHVPFFEPMVATASKVTQRILIDLLRDPRMDQMVKDIIRSNVEQIRAEVAKREASLRGVLKPV